MSKVMPIFTRTIGERKLSTFIYSLGLGFFALMFAALFEDFAGELGDFVDNIPEGMSAFLGDFTAASTPEGWLAIELYALFVPIILAIVGVGFGASAIGKEEESGTLEVLLASPISRNRIFVQKALAIAVQLAIIAMAVWLGVFIGTLAFVFEVSLSNVFWASTSAWLLGLVYGFLTLAVQGLTGRKPFALGIGSAVVAITYFANVVSQLVEYLDFLKYLSPFYYYDVSNILHNGASSSMLVLAGLAVLFYVIAHIGFVNRDTGVN